MVEPFSGTLWRRREAAVLLAAFTALLLVGMARDPQLQGSWHGPAALVLVGVFLAGFVLAVRMPSPAVFAGLAVTSTALTAIAPHSASGTLFAVIGGAAARLPVRFAVAVALAAAAAGLAVRYAVIGPALIGGLPVEALGATVIFLGVYAVRLRRADEARARDAAREAARDEERARLAREIHDVLAHSLSALAVQLDLAQTLLHRQGGDAAALRAVERAHALAREGLQDTRQAVAALRGDRLPGPEMLERLAADFECDAGVRCRLEIAPELPELTSEERVALYRTAQEALTNVRRHSAASSVALRLRPVDGGVELSVVDDGEPRRSEPGGGFGLIGMRERAELLGGRLEAGPGEVGGFRVRLWLPAS